jgi:hypothetical protein
VEEVEAAEEEVVQMEVDTQITFLVVEAAEVLEHLAVV